MSTQSSLPSTPSFRLDKKRALVTGAGRGIGLAAAAALAEFGAEVTLAARTGAEIAEAAAQINARERARPAGGSAQPLVLDVTDLPRMLAAIAQAGPFDVLVNNAGTNRPAALLDVTVEDFDAIYGLNVRAAYFVAQAVARGLVTAGRPGSIVNISSQMGHVGAPRRSVYCGSKHAVEGMTKAMAMDLAPHRIRVNTIGPTFIETPLAAGFLKDPAFRESVLAKIKLGRLGQVEDLMGAIVYLASDTSNLVTGTSLVVDGGWTAE
jgi:NAD(P)-dependent dehydrogenase (short-subunit alcohol dehydrogenase family)